jgi:hypothetical protein
VSRFDVSVSTPGPSAPVRPVGLLVVAVVEGLEALGIAIYAVVSVLGSSGRYPLQTFGVAGTFVVAAALLGLVAFGTFKARSWSRTPGIVWQIVQAIVGLSSLQGQGGQPAIAALLIVPAALAIVLLLSRSVREATNRR